MRWHRTLAIAAVSVLAVLASSASQAAKITIDKIDTNQGRLNVIFVEGEFKLGDEKRFANAARQFDTAIVALNSPGGNLFAGLEMGRLIREKGFATLVREDYECASACAIAWLGGHKRMMASGSTIGFHAASGPSVGDSAVANALVGAFLNQLNLSDDAIAYITHTDPRDITWLSFEDAEDLGIEVLASDIDVGGVERVPDNRPSDDGYRGPTRNSKGGNNRAR